MKELKHLGVIMAFLIGIAPICAINKVSSEMYLIFIVYLFPIATILSSVICKYMGWDK